MPRHRLPRGLLLLRLTLVRLVDNEVQVEPVQQRQRRCARGAAVGLEHLRYLVGLIYAGHGRSAGPLKQAGHLAQAHDLYARGLKTRW